MANHLIINRLSVTCTALFWLAFDDITHMARHTFGTMTLSNGVSIESVSKMLGHTNIKTTQIYARITDAKIGNDMAMFAGKMKGMESKFAINQ